MGKDDQDNSVERLREELRSHLLHWRGHWDKRLPANLLEVLTEINPDDLRKAATTLLHGPALCRNGQERPYKRIADGWQYCGRTCPCVLADNLVKSEATNMARRGVRNAAQDPAVKQQMAETCMERFGVPTSGASKARQAKAKATNLVRHGAENAFASPEIKQRLRERTRKHHGVDHISQSADHQAKMHARSRTLRNDPAYAAQIRDKTVATNTERFGAPTPAGSPQVIAKMRATNFDLYGGHPTNRHIEAEHRINGEADFRARFEGQKAIEMAELTGYNPRAIRRYARRWGVRLHLSMRNNENTFASQLTEFGIPFQRNARVLRPTPDTGDRRTYREIDFLYPEHKLGIEFSGAYWHSEACGRDQHYHAEKRAQALLLDIDLLQVFEDEWLDHPAAVLATIGHRLGLTQDRTIAGKCRIATLTHETAFEFLEHHHVFGESAAAVNLGLVRTIDEVLVAVMTFTCRNSSEGRWELTRYASQGSVVGGARKLLRSFEQTHEWTSITSFIDLRWSNERLYDTLGFKHDKTLPPDYAYVVGNRRYHKFNFRKSSKIFAKYADSGMTERQMAEAAGITRVYDAGKIRVIKYRPE